MTTQLPAVVSKWELAGIPTATILTIMLESEALPEIVKGELPRIMLATYILVALVRIWLQRKGKTDVTTGTSSQA